MKLCDTLVKISTSSHTKATIYALTFIIVQCIYVNILVISPLTFSFRCLRHKITPTIIIITDVSTTRITIIMILIIIIFGSSELLVCCELFVVSLAAGADAVTSKIICHSSNTAMKLIYKHDAPKQNAYKSNIGYTHSYGRSQKS